MPIYEYIAYILCFVVRSENEIYIIHIAYKLQLNMCELLCPNLKNRPKKKNQNRDGVSAGPRSAFESQDSHIIYRLGIVYSVFCIAEVSKTY